MRELTQPMVEGLPSGSHEETVRIAGRRVYERIKAIAEQDAAGLPRQPPSAPWARTAAEGLVTGGSCGVAVRALGATLDALDVPFRIIHLNVADYGASHIALEARMEDGRWMLMDPLMGFNFDDPTGRFLSLDELRQLPLERRTWLPSAYREGQLWSLYGPFERGSWAPLRTFLVWADSPTLWNWMEALHPKSRLIEPGAEVATASLFLVGLLVLSALRRVRIRRALYDAAQFKTQEERAA